MATTMHEQPGGSTFEPAVEFALIQLKANDDPTSIRALLKERFALKDSEVDEIMQFAEARHAHKEKNF